LSADDLASLPQGFSCTVRRIVGSSPVGSAVRSKLVSHSRHFDTRDCSLQPARIVMPESDALNQECEVTKSSKKIRNIRVDISADNSSDWQAVSTHPDPSELSYPTLREEENL
jgi:hypothetical protein